jgi:hypothetical protein
VLDGAVFWGVLVVVDADGACRFVVAGGAGERWNTAWSCPVYRCAERPEVNKSIGSMIRVTLATNETIDSILIYNPT